jgi:hypothetical protein
MPSKGGFQLTDGDIAIIKLVYEYRMLTRFHLAALTGRLPDKVHRRVHRLTRHRYLARIVLPQQKHIYFPGPEGISVLVEQGIAPREHLEHRLRHHERKELTLKHDLMVVDLHATLALAIEGTPIRLQTWKEGKQLWDTVRTPQGPLPVRPDGLFMLQDERRPQGANRRNFFLEADRSTTTHERFGQKLTAYWWYLQRQQYRQRYGDIPFRVVTVTLTPERAEGLAELAESTLAPQAHRYFLFASAGRFSLEAPQPLLAEAFLSPKDWRSGQRYRLMPEPDTAP